MCSYHGKSGDIISFALHVKCVGYFDFSYRVTSNNSNSINKSNTNIYKTLKLSTNSKEVIYIYIFLFLIYF